MTFVGPIEHVIVLVPARNEEVLLPRCLHSIARARAWLAALGVSSDLVVVSDASHDLTLERARLIVGHAGVVVSAEERNVGAARALAGRVALARSPVPPERCWLANTDADCEVPTAWLSDQVDRASRGIDAVAGVVDVDDFSEHDGGVAERFRLTYQIHDDGTHPHVHGANLGVRADAYLRAGGWATLTHSEDHDLWGRLRAMGATLLSDAALTVLTSGRRHGRAPNGFADALAAHNAQTAS